VEKKTLVGLNKSRRHGLVTVLIASLLGLALTPTAQATATILGPFSAITTVMGVGKITVVPPTSNSNGAWTFSSSNLKVATVSGNQLSILSAGSSTITATQSAIGAFTSRARSTQLRVNPGAPVIGAFPPISISITIKAFKLTPPASTSDGTWSYTSSDPRIASVLNDVVTANDGGTVVITARQSNTLNWTVGVATMNLTVVAITPTVGSFGDISIMKNSVASLVLVTPTSNSPGQWTFSSSSPEIASIAGNTITPLAVGKTTITATQARGGNYASVKLTMVFTVQGVVPTLGSWANVSTPFSSTLLDINPPSSNSLGAWTYTSSDLTVATITSGRINTLKPGVTTLTGIQAPSASYDKSAPTTMVLTVYGTPTIGQWSNLEKVVKDPDFALVPPTSTSPNSWGYVSSDPSVIEIANGIAKVKAAGVSTITATQSASTIWHSGTAQITIRVYGAIPTVGALAPISATVGDAPITIKAPTSDSTGTWTFTSSDPKVATVTGSTLTVLGAGAATISATQGASGIYSQSNTLQAVLTVKAKANPTPSPTVSPTPTPSVSPTVSPKPTPSPTVTSPSVGDFANLKITFGTVAPAIVFPVTSSVAPWTLKSSNSAVVTFVDTIIQMRGPGIATITATQPATANTPLIRKTFTIQVLPAVAPTKAPVVPVIKVTALKRIITISVTGAIAQVTIDGRAAKIGANTVKAGTHSVVVWIKGKATFTKVFSIK